MLKLIKSQCRKYLKNFLNSRGYDLVKLSEIDRLNQKSSEMSNEILKFSKELVFLKLPPNSRRVDLLTKLYGTSVSEAIYLAHYLHLSLKNDGDVCEMGIANGATSAFIANEITHTKKQLYLFDSFQGLSKPTSKDKLIDDILGLGSMDKYQGTMSYPVQEVDSRLKAIGFKKNRTTIIPGFIENSIHSPFVPKSVCFAYLDFDLYQPIKTGLNFLKSKLTVKSYVIVDDYGHFSSGAKTAVHEFLKENKNFKLILPHAYAGPFCIIEKVSPEPK